MTLPEKAGHLYDSTGESLTPVSHLQCGRNEKETKQKGTDCSLRGEWGRGGRGGGGAERKERKEKEKEREKNKRYRESRNARNTSAVQVTSTV